MKNYIERYIHAVTKRLPEASRLDVREELHSLIYNMLPENPTETEVEAVLISLGSPMNLAYQYQEEKRYLISPQFFNDYLNVLKIVTTIIFSIQILTGTIDSIFNLVSTTLLSMVAEVISNMLGGLLGNLAIGFSLVTIVFWAYQYGVQKGEVQWEVKDLPEIPKSKSRKISRFETSIELVFQVVFSIVSINFFLSYLDLLQITTVEGSRIPILTESVVNAFIPYFIAAASFGFTVILIKLYVGEWRYIVTLLYTGYELVSSLVIVLFIQVTNVIQLDALRVIASSMGLSIETLQQNLNTGINALTGIIILVVILDLGFTWKKTIEGYRES